MLKLRKNLVQKLEKETRKLRVDYMSDPGTMTELDIKKVSPQILYRVEEDIEVKAPACEPPG